METKIYLDDGSFGLDFDNAEISEKKLNEIIPLIGEIVLEFNYLEGVLDDIIIEVLMHPSSGFGHVVISKMSFSQKIDLFKNLYTQVCVSIGDSAFVETINKVAIRLQETAENRNRVIHARWFDANKDFFVRTKTGTDKKGVYGLYIKVNKTILNKYLSDIRKLQKSFDNLYEKIMESC